MKLIKHQRRDKGGRGKEEFLLQVQNGRAIFKSIDINDHYWTVQKRIIHIENCIEIGDVMVREFYLGK